MADYDFVEPDDSDLKNVPPNSEVIGEFTELKSEFEEIKDASLDKIATKLLRYNFILTALEFHTELVESGRELPRLRDYFSNPGNFEKHIQEVDSSPVLRMLYNFDHYIEFENEPPPLFICD